MRKIAAEKGTAKSTKNISAARPAQSELREEEEQAAGSRRYCAVCGMHQFLQRFCSAAAADKKITAASATKAETEHMRVALDNVKRRQPGTQKWPPEVAMQ